MLLRRFHDDFIRSPISLRLRTSIAEIAPFCDVLLQHSCSPSLWQNRFRCRLDHALSLSRRHPSLNLSQELLRPEGISVFDGKTVFVKLSWADSGEAGELLTRSVDQVQIAIGTVVPSQPDVGARSLCVGSIDGRPLLRISWSQAQLHESFLWEYSHETPGDPPTVAAVVRRRSKRIYRAQTAALAEGAGATLGDMEFVALVFYSEITIAPFSSAKLHPKRKPMLIRRLSF
jgi:hypothetical protein